MSLTSSVWIRARFRVRCEISALRLGVSVRRLERFRSKLVRRRDALRREIDRLSVRAAGV